MAYPASPALPISPRQQELIEKHVRKTTVPEREAFRFRVILNGAAGMSDERSARLLGTAVDPIKKWRSRWLNGYEQLLRFEQGQDNEGVSDGKLLKAILSLVDDAPRSGRNKIITPEQEQQIVALSCEKPEQYGLPVNTWTHNLLRQKAIELGIVAAISSRYVGMILKKNT
jgi:putative transposase